jgi:hypothetical protein
VNNYHPERKRWKRYLGGVDVMLAALALLELKTQLMSDNVTADYSELVANALLINALVPVIHSHFDKLHRQTGHAYLGSLESMFKTETVAHRLIEGTLHRRFVSILTTYQSTLLRLHASFQAGSSEHKEAQESDAVVQGPVAAVRRLQDAMARARVSNDVSTVYFMRGTTLL